jgi:hypothetical protein
MGPSPSSIPEFVGSVSQIQATLFVLKYQNPKF